MTANVQTSARSADGVHHAVAAAHPYALTVDADVALALARGRALQGRAMRSGFVGVARALRRLLAEYGRTREGFARHGAA